MIQIDTMTDEGIISVDHCYLRVVTDGDSWATHPNLQQATTERVGTQIALKKGADDILDLPTTHKSSWMAMDCLQIVTDMQF